MLRTFRECVKNYISAKNQRTFENSEDQYFENVSVKYPPEYTTNGIVYDIEVTTSKEVDWSKKGKLTPGSLVFLTPDFCNSVIFATLKNNPRADYSKSKKVCLKIKLEDDLFEDELSPDLRYAMVQQPAYFECYRHVLSAIKKFSESSLPLSDIITYFDFSNPEPKYLLGKKYCLHEKCEESGEFTDECACKVFNPLNDNEWPTASDLKLDHKQYQAFKVSLTKKVAVIQGPPGTGKTYIGVKVVKSLLMNVGYKPIIICCLTNHALDEFLKRMLQFTKKIVRLGSRSQSEVIEPHTLDNMMYAIKQYHNNEIPDGVLKKSLHLVQKIAETVLTQKMSFEFDIERAELEALTNEVNRKLKSYCMCLDKFLNDGALNDIIDSNYKTQLRHAAGVVEKSLSTSVMEWLLCSRSSDLYDKCRKHFSDLRKKPMRNLIGVKDIWALPEKKRFELFYYWRKVCLEIGKKSLEEDIETYKSLVRKCERKSINPVKLEILSNADVIGVTTTGACKYKELLLYTDSRIIVIEEAAQVLESHVIASLLPCTQHLIMIGDHEQLRPLPADVELSEKYNLKISMFERLFNNQAPSATLISQHRMKPCIAELLVPRPYKEYTSAEEVKRYEEIKGVESSVYFLDHRTLEDENSSGFSSSNKFEAQMITNFAKYLTSIFYSTSQITILATYAAQVILILKLLVEARLNDIRVTTVDNFQGEENDIILLSFVRSNPSAIGFLKESNRVCVALSRARMGMFCFGNFQFYADKNDLWKAIVGKLYEKNMIGDSLSLKCPKHNLVHSVKSPDGINNFLVNGCSEKCNTVLPCKHICIRNCHFEDPDHLQYLCKEPCNNMIDETRVCPRLCYQKCKKIKTEPTLLPCGHLSSKKYVKCFEEETRHLPCGHEVTVPCYTDMEKYQCKASESIILDCGHKKAIWCHQKQEKTRKFVCTEQRQETAQCGHIVQVPCHLHLEEENLLSFCNKSCGTLLSCGHPCVRLCRFCFDTGIHGFCAERCELFLSCGHRCGGFCGSPCPPCDKKCSISCGHNTFCINDCLRPCVECSEPCERKCKHQKCSKLCFEDCSTDPCEEPCFEKLPCKHQCIGLCGDPCPSLCRICNDDDDIFSPESVNCLYVELECEHVIEVGSLDEHISNCMLSLEWPCCPRCSSPIFKSVRYKEKLKEAKRVCIESNDTSEEISEVLYLVECMYGKNFIVPAQFLPIQEKIVRILKQENPKSHILMTLKNCVMLLKKLVNIAPKLKESNCDCYIFAKFDTLMLWIYHHLTQASYQQLKELEIAVMELMKLIDVEI